MKKELTLEKIVLCNEGIKNLLTEKLKPAFAFKILSLSKLIEPHIKSFEETKNKTIKDYGVEENGKMVIKDIDKFKKEMNDILQEKITLDFKPLTQEDFENLENITIQTLAFFEPFIEGEK